MATTTTTTKSADSPAGTDLVDASIPHHLAAENLIKNHVIGAVSIAIVPIPLIDIAAVGALQLRMIHKLSDHYGKDFSNELVRSLIASLGGSFLGYGGGMMAMSLLKVVPGVGWMLGMVSVPVVSGAATYAIGKVFQKHFEEGGTIFDLTPAKVKAYADEQYERGVAIAKAARSAAKSEPASTNKSATA